jgi:S1-C subfamily serine protease
MVNSMNGFEVNHTRSSAALLLLIFVCGLIVGGIVSCYITVKQIDGLKNDISNLEAQVSNLWGFQNVTYQNITLYQNSTALSELYENVRDSVVLIRGTTATEYVQGSGFVYNFSGIMFVITNYHVVHGTTSLSVTFSDGNGYAATVNGTDPYADLAVLSVDAPQNEFKPLQVVNSSSLRVGDPVIAIGNPYGLVGSMTTGVVSALGRTITEEEYTGGFAIANIIQTSAPINPGNSGGPLLNYYGSVVGITAAIINNSQGLGFAVPSNTILKEIGYIITNGKYDQHSYLGLNGTDMSYELAQEVNADVTYGWRVVGYLNPSPAHEGGVLIGDVIIAMNGTRIKNSNDLASYLEEKTLPSEALVLTVRRQNQTLNETITLGYRPYPF